MRTSKWRSRIAMVTGASRGIGRACALELAKAGHAVALAARQADKLQEVAAEIRAAGGTALAVTLDLASPESIEDAFLEGLEGVRPGSDPGQ